MTDYDLVHRAVAREVFERVGSGPSNVALGDAGQLLVEEITRGVVLMTLRVRSSEGEGSRHFVVRVQELR